MRKSLVICLLLGIASVAAAQEIKVGVSYNYMVATQWDNAIKAYNFSRPFVAEKQPLFGNGLGVSVGYLFKSNGLLKHGVNLSYNYFGSLSENQNFDNKLNLHFLSIGYLISLRNREKSTGFYTDFMLAFTTIGLFRSINGEPFVYDDAYAKAYGIGGSIGIKQGYDFKLKNNSYLSPFIALGYTPYLYSPNTEAVINQTKGLVAKSSTGILNLQVGLAFSFR
jgi:hypothetical protein